MLEKGNPEGRLGFPLLAKSPFPRGKNWVPKKVRITLLSPQSHICGGGCFNGESRGGF